MRQNPRLEAHGTIVARSTAPGAGAIAIVRLSGADARPILKSLMGGRAEPAPYRLVRAVLQDAHRTPLDDGMVVLMPGPKNYTGEDVVELHLHGGPAVVASVLAACVAAGARPAEPGEFTLRAFLHGRLDLAQAEAVGALVQAEDEAQRLGALAVLAGQFSEEVGGMSRGLQGLMAAWLAGLDFPDDTPGVTEITDAQISVWRETRQRLAMLADRVQAESQARQGVVLLGAVNVGKSTLVNAWSGAPRALVDASPGTTRDLIEVPLVRRGERFSVWDTAGQRQTTQDVEARGMALALAQAQQAAVVVWLVDAQKPTWPDAALLAQRRQTDTLWIVGARADLYDGAARLALTRQAAAAGLGLWGWVSGQSGEGTSELAHQLAQALATQTAGRLSDPHGVAMANGRHVAQLREAEAALEALDAAHVMQMPLDILLVELQGAVRALGQILGEDVDAGVIDRIFSDFCIGK